MNDELKTDDAGNSRASSCSPMSAMDSGDSEIWVDEQLPSFSPGEARQYEEHLGRLRRSGSRQIVWSEVPRIVASQ